jgi:alginate O-acetyltransferase complex protein AlgI
VLFNSDIFLFGFLPVALLGFFVAAQLGRGPAAIWLIIASLVFYSWWDPRFLIILVVSVLFNFAMSEAIDAVTRWPRLQTLLLASVIAVNLAALVYYKYLFSLFGFLGELGLVHNEIGKIALPLGISFFTFTQIGYLIDVKQGVAKDRGLLNYVLFVTFFPHLIAGPILHNGEIMPQFADPAMFRFSGTNFTVGTAIFVMGLLKKCILADPNSPIVAAGYAHVAELSLLSSWNVALSYSLQLYFDFSGYSDMAIGLARMFNVRFPLNFNSPYKAACIIDYWQRWHMTLTRYLTLYLYSPIALMITRRRLARGLGTTRKAQSTVRGFSNMVILPTMVTMSLAGIWHGAGLQFFIFGALHGIYLCINHAYRIFGAKRGASRAGGSPQGHLWKVAITYLAVLVASVFFRAPSVADAGRLLAGMGGFHGMNALGSVTVTGAWPALRQVAWLAALYAVVWGLPNTQQIMRAYDPALDQVSPGPLPWLRWRISPACGLVLGAATAVAMLSITDNSEFLYFQF